MFTSTEGISKAGLIIAGVTLGWSTGANAQRRVPVPPRRHLLRRRNSKRTPLDNAPPTSPGPAAGPTRPVLSSGQSARRAPVSGGGGQDCRRSAVVPATRDAVARADRRARTTGGSAPGRRLGVTRRWPSPVPNQHRARRVRGRSSGLGPGPDEIGCEVFGLQRDWLCCCSHPPRFGSRSSSRTGFCATSWR